MTGTAAPPVSPIHCSTDPRHRGVRHRGHRQVESRRTLCKRDLQRRGRALLFLLEESPSEQLLSTAADQLPGLRFTDLLAKGQGSQWQARLPTCDGMHRRRGERHMLLRPPNGPLIEVTATVTPTLYNSQPALLGSQHPDGQDLA
jgi:hypothetical protein